MQAGLRTEDEWINVLRIGSLVSGTSLNVFASNVRKGANSLSLIGAGSPTPTYGKKVLGGTATTSAGSLLWFVFPSAFGAKPDVVTVTDVKTANKWVFANTGSWQAGSIYIQSEDASTTVGWLAIGNE